MNLDKRLPEALLPWYDKNKRDLPWRHTRDPYQIWLSEIMLQQTRVEAVKGYYARFLSELPTISALAECDDEKLHKLWEGLGYYSRVRNLKKAAKIIEETYNGAFPREYAQILELPGIGEYTAGAICSIAFDQKVPAVDGNVLRVMARLTDDPTPIDTPSFKKQARQALFGIYPDRAGDFTQALIELGATVCGPDRAPRCGECPCREFCLGRARGTAEGLPVRSPKKDKKNEEMTLFIMAQKGTFGVQKRPKRGLLASLWSFPNLHGKLDTAQALSKLEEMGLRPKALHRCLERSHIFTHVRWEMRGYYLEVEGDAEGVVWMTPEQIETEAALPTAFRQFWEERDCV